MLTPAIILNNSPETCCGVPLTAEAKFILPGSPWHRFHRNGRMHLKTARRGIDAGAPFAEGYQSSSKPMAIGKALRVQSWLLCGG
jgi:hypothetical protein